MTNFVRVYVYRYDPPLRPDHPFERIEMPIHINVRFQAKQGKQAELARRMVELGPDVEALGGTSIVTLDSEDETVLYFIETFPDQAALDADMKTPLVQALIADLGELTVHGTDFRIERSAPVAG
jgi:quinol monooxygenase YgiN